MAGKVALVEVEDRVSLNNGEEITVNNDALQENENSMDSFESISERKSVPRAALTFMEVKSIVAASFGEDGRRCYKVHWRDSWVYDDHLFGCTELVENFWRDQKKINEKEQPKKPRKGTKRAATENSTKELTVIVIDNKAQGNQDDTLPTSNNSEADGGEWMLDPDNVGTDEETKENDLDWKVGSQTKKIRPTGRKYTLTCHVCRQDFELVTAFKRHYIDQHPGVKPFACDMCDKRFDRKENLSRHIRIHTGDRRYVCNYCGKGYTDPSGLKKHVAAKHSGMNFNCEICSDSFKSKEALSRHLTKHLTDCRLNNKKNVGSIKNSISSAHLNIAIPSLEHHTSPKKPLLENNTCGEEILLIPAEEVDDVMEVTSQIESESRADENLKTTTESLQNVVDQLQQFVNAEGGNAHQVVQYVQMSHETTATTRNDHAQQTGVTLSTEQEALNNGTVNSDGKQFIFTGEAHQLIPITINSNHQDTLPISTQQVMPVVASNQPTQIITVPIATTQAFVYTGAMTSADDTASLSSNINQQGQI